MSVEESNSHSITEVPYNIEAGSERDVSDAIPMFESIEESIVQSKSGGCRSGNSGGGGGRSGSGNSACRSGRLDF